MPDVYRCLWWLMFGYTCCLLLGNCSRYMQSFQFIFERLSTTPSPSNNKFFPKSGCGQLRTRFKSTMTISGVHITHVFIPPLMRQLNKNSFITLYRRKHVNIYFLHQKTTTLTINSNIRFTTVWTALQTTCVAVSNFFTFV